ncbi:hypothetical protein BUE80_DR003153 [Diplocarpon rosae]|nr:hypothetical protein BUE80_DR003153 [Diplocarpon rosae]
MLRLMRPPRALHLVNRSIRGKTFVSLSRLPLKLESKHQAGQISNIERVRFKKQWMRPKQLFIYIVAAYLGISIYTEVVLSPLDRAAADALQNLPREEFEEVNKPLFIPFPGTTKQLKPVPYRGSDPEWQEFVKFSKDKKLAQKVRDELASIVQSAASKHPVLTVRCGKQMALRRYWLDVDFPQFAPAGIEIGDNYIEWRTQPVEPQIALRIKQCLWPSALAQSSWSFIKVMVVDDVKHIATMLGLRSAAPPVSLDQLLTRHPQLPKGSQAPQLAAEDTSPAKTTAVAAPPKGLTGGSAEKPALMGKGPEELEVGSAVMALHAHLVKPMMAFRTKFSQTWRPAPDFPPRGSILVSGMVELDAPKAWLVFDVKASWDPKTRAYDPRSMVVKLRRMQPKKQGPSPN